MGKGVHLGKYHSYLIINIFKKLNSSFKNLNKQPQFKNFLLIQKSWYLGWQDSLAEKSGKI